MRSRGEAFLARSWPTLFLVAACLGLALANAVRASSVVAFGVVVVLAVGVVVPRVRPATWAIGLLLVGWWWGSARLDAFDDSRLAVHIGRSAEVEAVVTGPARRTDFALRVAAETRRFDDELVRERVLLQLPVGRSPPQGAVIAFRATAVAPREDDGEFDERGWLARRGVHVVLRGGDWEIVGRRGGIGGVGDRLRAHVAESITAGVSGERRAVLRGIVLGEDEGLTAELRDSFKTSGLYHLLAVSGQNVAFVAGAVLALAWLLGIARVAAEVAALTAIAGYVLAVGWQPSVVRAGIAGALASLAWLLARPRDRWHFLVLGASVLLAWTPAALLEPGFQLSFAAVASIFVLVPPLVRTLEGYPIPRGLALVLAVSAACGAATAPILWLHFGEVPVYSLLANVLATAAMPPLLGLALVGTLVAPVLPSAAVGLAWANGWIAAYLAACARAVAELPHARIGSGYAVAALLGAPAAVLLVRRLPRWRRLRVYGCAAAIVPALLVWQLWPAGPPAPPAGMRVTFLDVGQGDAVLLQVAEGAVLVDQGPPEARVALQLRELGVRRLDALVLTHPQRDHVGGAEEVLRRIGVVRVLDARLSPAGSEVATTYRAAAARDVPVLEARAGMTWQLGRLRLRVLWPVDTDTPGDDPNRLAIVLLATYGTVDVLLTADAETDVTARLLARRVEVLKVAHHGSEDPGLAAELRELRPDVAVVSAGQGNSYGHPRPETLATLAGVPGLRLYRTDVHGRVAIDTDGRTLTVRTEE